MRVWRVVGARLPLLGGHYGMMQRVTGGLAGGVEKDVGKK